MSDEFFKIACPGCSKRLKISSSKGGRKVTCPSCSTQFKLSVKTAPAPGSGSPFAAAPESQPTSPFAQPAPAAPAPTNPAAASPFAQPLSAEPGNPFADSPSTPLPAQAASPFADATNPFDQPPEHDPLAHDPLAAQPTAPAGYWSPTDHSGAAYQQAESAAQRGTRAQQYQQAKARAKLGSEVEETSIAFKAGCWMIGIGVASSLLPFVGLQVKGLHLLGSAGPLLGLAIGLIGAIMVAISKPNAIGIGGAVSAAVLLIPLCLFTSFALGEDPAAPQAKGDRETRVAQNLEQLKGPTSGGTNGISGEFSSPFSNRPTFPTQPTNDPFAHLPKARSQQNTNSNPFGTPTRPGGARVLPPSSPFTSPASPNNPPAPSELLAEARERTREAASRARKLAESRSNSQPSGRTSSRPSRFEPPANTVPLESADVLKVGTKIHAKFAGTWKPSSVVALDDNKITVQFDGWNSIHNKNIAVKNLRIDETVLQELTNTSTEPPATTEQVASQNTGTVNNANPLETNGSANSNSSDAEEDSFGRISSNPFDDNVGSKPASNSGRYVARSKVSGLRIPFEVNPKWTLKDMELSQNSAGFGKSITPNSQDSIDFFSDFEMKSTTGRRRKVFKFYGGKKPVLGVDFIVDKKKQLYRLSPYFDEPMYENSIRSEKGYVVAGMTIKTGKENSVVGFNVLFAKLENGKLNLKDIRRSPWIGSGTALDEDLEHVVSRQGNPVVGLAVFGSDGVTDVGIVIKQQ